MNHNNSPINSSRGPSKSKFENLQLFIVGTACSGKTSLIKKLTTGKFQQDSCQATIGVFSFFEIFKIDERQYKVQIWDTQGFDSMPGIIRVPQYKKAKGFIIMFDITDQKSFLNVKRCVQQIKQFCPVQNQHMLLIGNKKDLSNKREVSYDQVMEYSEKQEIQYREISVKTLQHQSIRKLFLSRVKLLVSKVVADNIFKESSIKIKAEDQKKKGCIQSMIQSLGKFFGVKN